MQKKRNRQQTIFMIDGEPTQRRIDTASMADVKPAGLMRGVLRLHIPPHLSDFPI